MKELLKAIGIVLVVASVFFMCNFVALALFHKGMPYTWQLGGHAVEDSTYYGGQYYQVNDTIRVVASGDGGNSDRYTVYRLNNDKWKKTSAWTYRSIHDSRYEMLHYLRSKYNDYLHEEKYTKKELVWQY